MMNPKKYQIEKILHELIRDLPKCQKAARGFDRGLYTFDDALKIIASAYRDEISKQE